jgi:hypothetical protein
MKVKTHVKSGESLGPDNIQRKHITTINFEPISVEVGMGMSRG